MLIQSVNQCGSNNKCQLIKGSVHLVPVTADLAKVYCVFSFFSRSLLPGGNGCDRLCVKAAPAQCFSSSDHQSPAPVAPFVLQLDSLQSFPDL